MGSSSLTYSTPRIAASANLRPPSKGISYVRLRLSPRPRHANRCFVTMPKWQRRACHTSVMTKSSAGMLLFCA